MVIKNNMEMINNTYLKFIDFRNISNYWDVKRLSFNIAFNSVYKMEKLWEVLTPISDKIKKDDYNWTRKVVSKITFNNWELFLRDENKTWMDVYITYPKNLLVSNINFHQWAIAINNFWEEIVCSTHYQPYQINRNLINEEYLILVLRCEEFKTYVVNQKSNWIKTESKYTFIKDLEIPLPSLEEQNRIVKEYNKKLENSLNSENKALGLEKEIESYLMEELEIEVKENKNWNKGLQIVEFKDLEKWNIWNEQVLVKCNKYETIKIWDSIRNINSKIDKVQTKDYLENWKIPIVSQENNLISWYTNKNLTTINWNDLPLIVFWDHSKTVKYIDFEFVCWADWVRLMKPIKEFNTEFYYYYISSVVNFINPIESYTRHWKYLSQINIPIPPLEVQEKIVKYIWDLKEEINSLKKLSYDLKESAKVEFEKEIFS